MEISIHIIAILTAFILDKLFGDPSWLPHPIIGFGKAISFSDKKFNCGKNRVLKGAFVTIILGTITFTLFYVIIRYSYQFNQYIGFILETLFIFFGIAGTTLIREGKAVFNKLGESLDAGRKQVGRIVGRDTSQLTHNQVCAATLETMAENLSDGVVAPLFWYVIAGVPGMMAYKMINTLDSMIGYKNEKYIRFGRFAARLDDVANFIPARLTSLLMIVCSGRLKALQFVFKYGKAHSSPNAGYPEAALAGILNVQFGGSHIYFGEKVEKPFIGKTPRTFIKSDLFKTIRVSRLVEIVTIIIIMVLIYYEKAPLI